MNQKSEDTAKVPWSVFDDDGDGYATEIETVYSKEDALKLARARGGAFVSQFTQMHNEPLGQVHEKKTPQSYKFVD